MANSSFSILNDLPTDIDALDFKSYAKTIDNICKMASTPLTIGIFGSWGSGKTSLMKMIREGLPRNFASVWFDAWKYENEQTLWRAFLLNILDEIEKIIPLPGKELENEKRLKELNNLKTMLYRSIEVEKLGGVTIDFSKLGGQLAKGAVQIGLSFVPPLAQLTKLVEELQKASVKSLAEDAADAIRRERSKEYFEQVQSLEQFHAEFGKLVQNHIKNNRLVVFVDDLDRCLPEQAVRLLEAIKLFADVPGCIFILGLDHEIISRGIEIHYQSLIQNQSNSTGIDGNRYLEKIIQLPFLIPPIEHSNMERFIENLVSEWPDKECPKVFAKGLQDNPRQIKRTMNVFLMLWQLALERRELLQGKIKPIRLAKVVTIQAIAPDLYKLIAGQPGLLRQLEVSSRQKFEEKVEAIEGTEEEIVSQLKDNQADSTQKEVETWLAKIPEVSNLLRMHNEHVQHANFMDLNNDDLRMYFTLTQRVDTPPSSYEEQSHEAIRLQQEMILAQDLLQSISPAQLPALPGWQIAAQYQRSREVSADFYDFIDLPGGKVGLVIADVADKGLPAVMFMTLSQTLIRAVASEHPDHPEIVMKSVNKELVETSQQALFVTVFYGILEPASGNITYCNAGHPSPFILPSQSGSAPTALQTRGIALGIVDEADWKADKINLAPGDALVLYTDGITDTYDEELGDFGEERLTQAVAALHQQPAQQIAAAVIAELDTFRGEKTRVDDVTLLVISRDPRVGETTSTE